MSRPPNSEEEDLLAHPDLFFDPCDPYFHCHLDGSMRSQCESIEGRAANAFFRVQYSTFQPSDGV